MDLFFVTIQKEIQDTIAQNPYTKEYYQNICKVLNCDIEDLAKLQLFIPSIDVDCDNCNLEWFIKQPHIANQIDKIIVDPNGLMELVQNPDNKQEFYLFSNSVNIVKVVLKDGTEQYFVSEVHGEKIDSKVYCSTKDTHIPEFNKTTWKVKCHRCNNEFKIVVNSDDAYHYLFDKEKKFIKQYFPYLTSGEQELLISRTCDKCWDEIMPKDE